MPQLASNNIDAFITQSANNLITLKNNLAGLGYQFGRPNGPIEFASESDRLTVNKFESTFAPLPLLVKRWYETFRCVDFSQDEHQLFDDHSSSIVGLGYNITLVFRDLEWCLDFRSALSDRQVTIARNEDGLKRLLPFGSFASNCEPKGVWLPDDEIDPVIYDDGGGPIRFSEEIAAAIASGGFPFWSHIFAKRRPISPLEHMPKYPQILEKLKAGLIFGEAGQ